MEVGYGRADWGDWVGEVVSILDRMLASRTSSTKLTLMIWNISLQSHMSRFFQLKWR